MVFKGYIFVAFVVLVGVVSFAINEHINKSIKQGVESELCQQNLEFQNEAVNENALHKEQIKQHNETQNERLEALEFKYTQIQSEASSCEAKLNELEKSLRLFYETH